MKLDKARFAKFWDLFVEEPVASRVQKDDPMLINNGVSEVLAEALLGNAENESAYHDCFGNESWI